MSTSIFSTFLFIRHGQTDWNKAGRWQGHADMPLNETGMAQARAVADRLSSWSPPITMIISSDLSRCTQTTTPIAAALGLTPRFAVNWRERNVGAFQGYTHAENEKRFPDLVARMRTNGALAPPQGESFIALQERAVNAFTSLHMTVAAGEVVVVVTHGALLRALFSHVIGFPPGKMGRFSTGHNTGLSEVRVAGKELTLIRLNDSSHLEMGSNA